MGSAAGHVDRRHGAGAEPLAVADRARRRARSGRRAGAPSARGSRAARPTSGTRRASWRWARGRRARVFERRGPEVSAGNGSVMYCAPLGVVRAGDPDRLLEEAPALSRLTHWDGRCQTACLAVTLAVAALVRGEPRRGGGRAAVEAVADREGGEELEYLVGEAGRARPIDGPDMGFTLFTAGSPCRSPARDAGSRKACGTSSGSAATPTRTRRWRARCSAPRTASDAIPPAWLDGARRARGARSRGGGARGPQ